MTVSVKIYKQRIYKSRIYEIVPDEAGGFDVYYRGSDLLLSSHRTRREANMDIRRRMDAHPVYEITPGLGGYKGWWWVKTVGRRRSTIHRTVAEAKLYAYRCELMDRSLAMTTNAQLFVDRPGTLKRDGTRFEGHTATRKPRKSAPP
jgi:hypothetical protein